MDMRGNVHVGKVHRFNLFRDSFEVAPNKSDYYNSGIKFPFC